MLLCTNTHQEDATVVSSTYGSVAILFPVLEILAIRITDYRRLDAKFGDMPLQEPHDARHPDEIVGGERVHEVFRDFLVVVTHIADCPPVAFLCVVGGVSVHVDAGNRDHEILTSVSIRRGAPVLAHQVGVIERTEFL